MLLSVPSDSENEVIIKWADFGLSHHRQNHGVAMAELRGKENWLAPELLHDPNRTEQKRETTESDVFAEGILFAYLILDGKHPFGATTKQIQINITKGNPLNIIGMKGQYETRG